MKIKRVAEEPEEEEDRLYRAWRVFHEENPHIYGELVTETRDYMDATGKPPSICMMTEVVRAKGHIRTRSTDGYKINNNHRAIYAREIMRREPDLADTFETRERTAK